MKLIEKKNNCSYFTFEHSHSYQDVQKSFLSAVSSLTPDDIVVSIVQQFCCIFTCTFILPCFFLFFFF